MQGRQTCRVLPEKATQEQHVYAIAIDMVAQSV
jgi:hypothetical protein